MSRHLRAGLLIAVSRVLSQAAQFTVFVLAAALMGPAEFGVFALVSAWAYILAALAGSGWAEYVMQWQGDARVPARVLGLSVISGGLMTAAAAALTVLAPLVTADPVAMPLMLLFSATIWLGAVANTLSGVLNWQERLTAAALTIIFADLVSLGVTVGLLLAGHGVFALAWGRVAFTGSWMLTGLAASRIWPDIRPHRAEIRPVLAYVARITVVRLLMNLRLYAATFVIGAFLGAAETGWFRAGQRIAGALGEVMTEPGRVLAWSLFRGIRDRAPGTPAFHEGASRIFPVALAVSLPLFAALILLAEDVIGLLLGPEWLPAVPVLQALALAQAIFCTGFALEPILSLAGAVRVLPRLMLVSTGLGLGLTLAAAPWGMIWIALAQVAAAALIFLYNAWMLWRHAAVDWRRIAHACRYQLLSVLVATALAAGFRAQVVPGPGLWPMAVTGVVLALAHLALLWLLDPGIRRLVAATLQRGRSTRY